MVPALAQKRYWTQKNDAKKRGIPFLLTPQEWWDWWQASGRWEQRGVGRGKYVMCRRNDRGPYQLGNIYCATNEQNGSDIDRDLVSRRTREGMRAWAVRVSSGVVPPMPVHAAGYATAMDMALLPV